MTPRSRTCPRVVLVALVASWMLAACGDDETTPDLTDASSDAAHDVLPDDTSSDADTARDSDDRDGDGDADEGDAGADAMDAVSDAPLSEAERVIAGVPLDREWTVDGLSDHVHVLFVEMGVPHIYAENELDLFRVMGFLMARDRYFQFELGRRLGLGLVSELLGDSALETDLRSRGQGMTRVAQRLLASLTPEQEAIFDAYADGINDYIAAVAEGQAPAPTELSIALPLLGATGPTDLMKPVTRADLAGFAAVAVFELGYETEDIRRAAADAEIRDLFDGEDFAFAGLRRAGVRHDFWGDVSPLYDVASAPDWSWPDPGSDEDKEAAAAPGARIPPRVDTSSALPRSLARRALARREGIAALLGFDIEDGRGSNAWAVAGAFTADGTTYLAGDGHLPLDIPSIFYQIGLDTHALGGGELKQVGLVFPGIPHLAVGTNGDVAWSQTFLRGDITDWYLDEIELAEDGLPARILTPDGWEDLVRRDERYTIADVPALGSVGREEVWPRWETPDGRWLADVEGRDAAPDEELGDGEALVNLQGDWVVPGDTDGDGTISAITYDYTGFDIGPTLRAVREFGAAEDVEAFRAASRRLVAYAQNIVVADREGGIYYSGYNATPCREYLARDESGAWLPGANPMMLLDGTTYRGFRIPLTDDGLVDHEAGLTDPYACVIPMDAYPFSINPEQGFLLTANNDLGGMTFDGELGDEPYYVGGPWNEGYRASTIERNLARHVAEGTTTVDSMVALQGDVTSRLGEDLGPFLLESLAAARGAADAEDRTALPAWQRRVASRYETETAALVEVEERIGGWLDRGAIAASGVETFYNEGVTSTERDDAIATMIFGSWYRRFFALVFADEGIDAAWRVQGRSNRARALMRIVRGRGEDNPEALASWNVETEESAFFDTLGTDEVERAAELSVEAMIAALERLRSEPERPGVGGFGTSDMSEWLWGLRHQVKFESILLSFAGDNDAIGLFAESFSISPEVLPLAESIPPDDARAELPWFPRPGDWHSVDAANSGLGFGDYFYSSGPVMRMVIGLSDDGVRGENIVPGGQSGRTASEHFADQAAAWLGNETIPIRFTLEEVVEGATHRERFDPR